MLHRLLWMAPLWLGMLALPAAADPRPTGLTFASQDELRGVPLAATPFSGTEMPKRIDLSAHMPPPGNQGNQNSCVGWATAYALKSYQEKVEERRNLAPNGRVDPRMVFSPSFIYHQINNGRDGGSTFIDALNLLSNQGAVSLADMPYDESDFESEPPPHLQAKARRYRIDYWRQVNVRDPKEIKAQLSAGYPVLIGAMIDQGFVQARAGHVWRQQLGESLGGHAMVLVGYDDARQAFKLINSWGQGWGDKGFGWIDYRFLPQVVREGYVAKDALNGQGPGPETDPELDPEIDPEIDPETDPTPEPDFTPDPEVDPEIDPETDPDYEPDYEPAAEQADFQIGDVEFNLPAPGQEYAKYGPFMKLTGQVRIPPGAGQQTQIVIRFYFNDGSGGKGEPVTARIPELFSIPGEGIAAAGTPAIALPADGIEGPWEAYVPYSAFHLPAGRVDLIAEPMLYVDSFGIRSGDLIPFWVESEGTPGFEDDQQSYDDDQSYDDQSYDDESPDQDLSDEAPAGTGPVAAVGGFFRSLAGEDYFSAWQTLSETSRQAISELAARQLGADPEQVRQALDSDEQGLLTSFMSLLAQEYEVETWLSQSYALESQQGTMAWVMASPAEFRFVLVNEDGAWKLDLMQSFEE